MTVECVAGSLCGGQVVGSHFLPCHDDAAKKDVAEGARLIDEGLVSLTRDAVVAGYRGIEHATERLGACRVGQQGDAQR